MVRYAKADALFLKAPPNFEYDAASGWSGLPRQSFQVGGSAVIITAGRANQRDIDRILITAFFGNPAFARVVGDMYCFYRKSWTTPNRSVFY